MKNTCKAVKQLCVYIIHINACGKARQKPVTHTRFLLQYISWVFFLVCNSFYLCDRTFFKDLTHSRLPGANLSGRY